MKTKPLPDLCQYDKAECAPKSKASKDKRHWCRGKVGVRHKVRWMIVVGSYGITSWRLVCLVCEKKLAYYHRPHWYPKEESEYAYAKRCAKAFEEKQANTKRRLAYYLDFVD